MSGWGETIRTVVYAVLIALVVRTVAFEPFNIPSGSMKPTLLIGDYLFVSKYSYGYSRHSLPFSFPPFAGRILFTPPERGDVAVFKVPYDNSTDFIKRVIGLPGDTVQVRQGLLYINGVAVERRRDGEAVFRNATGGVTRVPQFVETLPNGREHVIVEESDFHPLDNTDIFTVPDGHYFMMGDNRDSSIDSRARPPFTRRDRVVGMVPAENLVGRAEILFFSTDGTAQWWEVWAWPTAIRWSRLFQSIT